MNRTDAEKVVKDLIEKPFVYSKNTIETDSGYVITKKVQKTVCKESDIEAEGRGC